MELMQQDSREESSRLREEASKQQEELELMELSLGSGTPSAVAVEKEHMFDKVVTPSDVGKLNRLVIPKQHAEKYFPLDSSSNEKGLLLNFEDRNGKLWRFRYSYWNSSQSYVMTKGWSRFVKEKKLDAGDIVSFQRGVGELYRHRLYIDWRPRDHHHAPHLINPFFLPNQYSIRWNNATLYSLPQPQHFNFPGPAAGGLYYLRSASEQQLRERRVIIDSVPVAATSSAYHHNQQQYATNSVTASGKRLRLFGVNMECASSAEDSRSLSMASNTTTSSRSLHQTEDNNSARASMLFDLDPSLQYHPHS